MSSEKGKGGRAGGGGEPRAPKVWTHFLIFLNIVFIIDHSCIIEPDRGLSDRHAQSSETHHQFGALRAPLPSTCGGLEALQAPCNAP